LDGVEGGGLEGGELVKSMCFGGGNGSKNGDGSRTETLFEGSGLSSAFGDSGSKRGDEDLFGVFLSGDGDRSAEVGGGSENGVLVELLGVLQMDDSTRCRGEHGEDEFFRDGD
jgi:hypothetical protein